MDNNEIGIFSKMPEGTPASPPEKKNDAELFPIFCEKYVKVLHPVRNLVPLDLHEFQRRLVRMVSSSRFVIGKKFRQGGFTTLMCAWLLYKAMTENDQYCMMMFKTDREAITYNYVVRTMIEHLPEDVRPKMKVMNHHEMHFAETDSRLWFHTFCAARGKAVNWLYLDEVSFWEHMDECWKAMYPTLSCGGSCVILSTPSYRRDRPKDWFRTTYENALEGKNQFAVYAASYTEHPEYRDPEWARQVRENLGELGWRQEVLAEFV